MTNSLTFELLNCKLAHSLVVTAEKNSHQFRFLELGARTGKADRLADEQMGKSGNMAY